MILPTRHLLVAALLFTGVIASAQQLEFLPDATPPGDEMVKYTLLKPDDKTSEIIKPTERNPFGKSDDALKALTTKGTNEENTIRDRLTQLRVVGVSPGKNGLRVMLGDMVLEAGQTLPPVLVDQSVDLRVNTITTSAIELVWVEKKATGLPPRSLTLTVDLRPYVRYMLHGQPSDKNQWQKMENGEDKEKNIGRQFPDVSHVQGGQTSQVAQKSINPVSKLQASAVPLSAAPAPAPASGSPAEGASAKENPSTWDQAVGFLNQLVKMENPKK